jgi:uncharacterized membrane protein YoaK (UPF0700 family)
LNTSRLPPADEPRVTGTRISVERSFAVAIALSFAGGYLDAFTWLAHDRVLANAQTANVVLLGVYAAMGQWNEAFRHLPPIIAFVAGVFVALSLRDSKKYDTHRVSLTVEIIVLLTVMILHVRLPNIAGTLGISFAAALQTTSFAAVESWTFSSVMTTGNLSRFAEALYARSMGRGNATTKRQAWVFASISVMFGVGAGVGALATDHFASGALFFPTALLCWVLWQCTFDRGDG